jgi:hypothetical protein
MNANNDVISVDQVAAANELYNLHLGDWRLANTALGSLNATDFQSEEACLVKIAALDSLYSTGLRFKPGSRENIARGIYKNRETFCEAKKSDVQYDLVERIAKEFLDIKTDGHVSFASKFCHLFISHKYPIFDNYACIILKRLDKKIKPYSSFCKSINELANSEVTVLDLDRFLWLAGNYVKWKLDEKKNSDKSLKLPNVKRRKKKTSKPSEVIKLFTMPNDAQKKLLERLNLDGFF